MHPVGPVDRIHREELIGPELRREIGIRPGEERFESGPERRFDVAPRSVGADVGAREFHLVRRGKSEELVEESERRCMAGEEVLAEQHEGGSAGSERADDPELFAVAPSADVVVIVSDHVRGALDGGAAPDEFELMVDGISERSVLESVTHLHRMV